MKKHDYHLEGLMALLLFGVFAVCLLMVLLTGADSYQGLTRRDRISDNRRVCAQYLATRVRQADSRYLTISSDGNGSMPRWNADRSAITGITMGRVTSLNEVMRELVCGGAMALEAFLPFVTRNTAESLDLFPRKGAIAPGADADLLLLDQSLHVASTMARGRWMLREGEMRFEPVYQG